MMRSLFAGVSGLRNHQTRMDVIGNNIANVNTTGFKASRVNFQDILNQTVQGASKPQGNRGGTNPMQVGLGMGVASIDTIFTPGSYQTTGKQTDLSIQDDGFFILANGNEKLYTRAGNFDFDVDGNYLVPGTGLKVMGWMADTNGNIVTNADPTGIKIPVGDMMKAQKTSNITFGKNLSASATAGATSNVPTQVTVYDTQGNAYNLTGSFEKQTTPDNTWKFTPAATIVDKAGATVAKVTPTTGYTITFDATGKYTSVAPATGITIDPTGLTPASPYAGAGSFITNLKFSDMTQFASESTAKATEQDGWTDGTLNGVSVDSSGTIVGSFSNGKTKNLAQVALAVFNNPAGLMKKGSNMYVESNNSGIADIGTAGSGGRGTFSAGTLEMSNVDLAQEFSNMIITQRGFQANSKIITTTDEMLEQLANLKR